VSWSGLGRPAPGKESDVAANPSIGWKLLGTLSAVLAGLAARKALVTGWRATTGKNPPANPAAPGTEWKEAIPYALASGAAMGLARMLATRKAAGYYRKSTGHLPPGMEEVT
jgi:hypothetical protein